MKITRLLGVGFLVLVSSFIVVGNASALRVAPTVVELSSFPGEPIVGTFNVVNNESKPMTLQSLLYEAAPNLGDEFGYANLVAPTQNSTLANWIKLNENSTITLQPGERKDVRFIVAVPDNASPGGHYAAIALTGESTSPTGSGATIVPQISVNVALDIAGTAIEKADVVSFATSDGKTSYDKLPVSFSARINNGGNRHFRPVGGVTIKNMFGSVVAQLPVKTQEAGGNILPGSTRQYNFDWLGEFAFGKYTATLDVAMGGAGSASKSLELWVMPAGLLVLWLIIAIIIVVILILLIRRALLTSPGLKK